MKVKKIAALIAASTMLLSTVTAFADETASSSSATVSSSGTVNAYDATPQYVVTLPTANSLGFTVDPYGFLDMEEGEVIAIKDLGEIGSIVAASGSGAFIRNMSSTPIEVTITTTITNSGDATLEAKPEDVTGSATNMFLALIPSANKVKMASGSSVATDYNAASSVIPIASGSGIEIGTFYLKEAEYEVKKSGSGFTLQRSTTVEDNYDATMFQIGGIANGKGTWDAYRDGGDATIELSAVFAYEAVEEASDEIVEGIYGLVTGTATTIAFTGAAGKIPLSDPNGTAKKSSADGIDYELTMTAGKLPVITFTDAIKSFKVGSSASSLATSTYMKLSADKKTIDYTSSGMSTTAGTVRYLQVTFNNDTSILIKISFE